MGTTEEVHMSDTRKDILEYLEENGATGPKELSKALGKNYSTTKVMVRKMLVDGVVVNDNGKYKKP
jgi:DNA-binding Lrp family transcriptional regulator